MGENNKKKNEMHWLHGPLILMWNQLLFNPLFYRKMMEHHFEFLCFMQALMVNHQHLSYWSPSNVGSFFPIGFKTRTLMDAQFIFFKNIRFWNKKQTKYFLTKYRDMNKNLCEFMITSNLIYPRIKKKARKFGLEHLIRFDKIPKMPKNEFTEEVWIDCCNYDCDASKHTHPEKEFKFCRRCKMVYYCSRKCQKIDW